MDDAEHGDQFFSECLCVIDTVASAAVFLG
jgi:hypothetical protein